MTIVDLLPLSVSEVRGHQPRFLDSAFQGRASATKDLVVGQDLASAVLTGGYPTRATTKAPFRVAEWDLATMRRKVAK